MQTLLLRRLGKYWLTTEAFDHDDVVYFKSGGEAVTRGSA